MIHLVSVLKEERHQSRGSCQDSCITLELQINKLLITCVVYFVKSINTSIQINHFSMFYVSWLPDESETDHLFVVVTRDHRPPLTPGLKRVRPGGCGTKEGLRDQEVETSKVSTRRWVGEVGLSTILDERSETRKEDQGSETVRKRKDRDSKTPVYRPSLE